MRSVVKKPVSLESSLRPCEIKSMVDSRKVASGQASQDSNTRLVVAESWACGNICVLIIFWTVLVPACNIEGLRLASDDQTWHPQRHLVAS